MPTPEKPTNHTEWNSTNHLNSMEKQTFQVLAPTTLIQALKEEVLKTLNLPIKTPDLQTLKRIKRLQEKYKERATLSLNSRPLSQQWENNQSSNSTLEALELSLTFLLLHHFLWWISSFNKSKLEIKTTTKINHSQYKQLLDIWSYLTFELHKMLTILKRSDFYRLSLTNKPSIQDVISEIWRINNNIDNLISPSKWPQLSILPPQLPSNVQKNINLLYEQLKQKLNEMKFVTPKKAS